MHKRRKDILEGVDTEQKWGDGGGKSKRENQHDPGKNCLDAFGECKNSYPSFIHWGSSEMPDSPVKPLLEPSNTCILLLCNFFCSPSDASMHFNLWPLCSSFLPHCHLQVLSHLSFVETLIT